MTQPRPRLRRIVCTIALLTPVTAGPALAQSEDPALKPRWTVGLEVGAQLPTTLYDERVIARLESDSFFLSTSYQERLDLAPVIRGTIRFRPESSFGMYAAGQYGWAPTIAVYTGGIEPRETIARNISFWTFEAGVSVKLGEWGRGGQVDYTLAPAMVRHSLDTSAGHRDAFAQVAGNQGADNLPWSKRSWSSWAFSLGASVRIPVSERVALRLSAHDHVIAVGTSQLESQERQDVLRITGRAPLFLYSSFTAHYPTFRAGAEYVLAWQPAEPEMPRIALPGARQARSGGTPPAVLASRRHLAAADTVAALAALREGVELDAEDAATWRELALVLGAVADQRPAIRDEAWGALQRALHLNPGDPALLMAFGRMQSLMNRAGERAPDRQPLALSAVNARADAAGGLSVGFALRNLGRRADEPLRYRVVVEVVDADGEAVPMSLAEALGAEPVTPLELEREHDPTEEAIGERLELRLARVRPGPHSVQVRLTDLATGQTVEGSTGFELR